ncbi:MAG: cell division protease FtsH [Frankiaceae bacterium]|jgi:cell division protease FtsH|nr:cell division protease FtsH [Frankiaceae bacterium]
MLTEVREAVLGFAGTARNATKVAVRNWRRARVQRRKTRGKQVYVLTATLLLLGLVFVWSLSYLAPEPHGRRLTIDQFGAIASAKRLTGAEFHDEDAQVSGSFLCEVAPAAGGAGAAPAPATPPAAGGTAFAAPAAPPPACDDGAVAVPAAAQPAAKPAKPVATKPAATRPATVTPAPVLKRQAFWMPYPKSDSTTAVLIQLAADGGARVTVDPQTRKGDMRIVTTLVLPLLMLANLFVLLFTSGKGGSAGIGEVETFGSIGKGRFSKRKKQPITFAEVAGADEAVEELKEVRDYLADPDRYKVLGAQPPKGVLLIGPPGCGKTLLAKAVAGEVGVPFFSVAGAEFVESLVGVGAARVRDLFRRVRAVAPAVVFIDELDAAGRKRAGGGGSGGNEEREQTLNQILVEMDGFDVGSGIVVMAATNRPDILDPALLRPGRFDRHVTVDRPDLVGRVKILELHARGKPFTHDVDFGYVARRTPGFSGADLSNVVNEAALLAVRQGKPEIETPDLEDAIQRTLSGTARKGRVLNPEERKRAAYHESAHVIVAAATGRFDEVHRVTILAGGGNVGAATIKADQEAAMLSKSQLQSRIVTHLAGVAAEELVFGEPSTGSEKDIELATNVARDMVARYGMSDKLGRLRFLAADVDGFLDADVPLGSVSGMTHQDVDHEMRRIVEDAEREATNLLVTHRLTLDALAARLETEETIEGPDLEAVLSAVRPDIEMFGTLLTGNDADARVSVPTGRSGE